MFTGIHGQRGHRVRKQDHDGASHEGQRRAMWPELPPSPQEVWVRGLDTRLHTGSGGCHGSLRQMRRCFPPELSRCCSHLRDCLTCISRSFTALSPSPCYRALKPCQIPRLRCVIGAGGRYLTPGREAAGCGGLSRWVIWTTASRQLNTQRSRPLLRTYTPIWLFSTASQTRLQSEPSQGGMVPHTTRKF